MKAEVDRLESLLQDLRDIRCPVMAEKLAKLYREPEFLELDSLSLLERIVHPQFEAVQSSQLNARLKRAKLDGTEAALSTCVDSSERTYLPNGIIPVLRQFNFVTDGQNVCIVGPSGSGKSYLAKALSSQACNHWRVLYCHCDSLLAQLADLKESSNVQYTRKLASLSKLDLLVIDDFLLQPVGRRLQLSVLFDLLESRCEKKHSTVVCSQRSPEAWNALMGGDVALSDAIVRRATLHYTVVIETPIET